MRYGVVNGRFQVLHLKHMEYLLAAKMRCDKLYIGLSNPDSLHTKDSKNDFSRSEPTSNPLTYHQRCEMIRGAMREFNVPDYEYEFIPFPINYPEYIPGYVPEGATFFMGLFDEWDEEKYRLLSDLGVEIEILWDRPVSMKGISSSEIRERIGKGEEWASLVPKSVYAYLTENELDKKIARLAQMRLNEKVIVPMQAEGEMEERNPVGAQDSILDLD